MYEFCGQLDIPFGRTQHASVRGLQVSNRRDMIGGFHAVDPVAASSWPTTPGGPPVWNGSARLRADGTGASWESSRQ